MKTHPLDPMPVALVIGAGDATGGAIARRFAREGYAACVTRRSLDKLQELLAAIGAEGGVAHGFASDARKEEEVMALVEKIETTIGPIEVLVFNIGANAPSSILQETARKYFKIWEMACFGGFLNGFSTDSFFIIGCFGQGKCRHNFIEGIGVFINQFY